MRLWQVWGLGNGCFPAGVSQHEVMEWVTRDIEGMLVGASYESLHAKVTEKASSD